MKPQKTAKAREKYHLVSRLSVIRRFPKTTLTPGTGVERRVSAGTLYTNPGTMAKKRSRRASLEQGAQVRVVVPVEGLVTRINHFLR